MTGKRDSKFLKASELEIWENLPHFIGSTKKVGRYHVEIIGASDRGALINIWENEKSTLHHIWTPSDDGEWMKLDEVNFMHYRNARTEYRELKNESAVLNLMGRNM